MKVYELLKQLLEIKSGLNVKVNVYLSIEKLKALLKEAKEEGYESNSITVSLNDCIYDINDKEIIFEAIPKIEDDGGFEIHDDVGLVEIKSLEQHNSEIRKPLEEPSHEECEIVELCGQVECSNCNHIFTDETFTFDEEYVCPDDGYEFYKANYCPHCGAKIKRRREKDE